MAAPGDVILDIVKRLDDQSGAGFIGRELLQVGSASEPGGAAQCGRVLMEAGLVDEAEALYHAMERSFPRHPGGFAGLAQVAMRRKSWPEALTRWDSILASFPAAHNAFWLSARALVLFELDRRDEATAIHADLLDIFPDEPASYAGLAQLAVRQHRWAEALEQCDKLLAKFADHAAANGWRVLRANALFELGRAAETEDIAKRVVETAPGLQNALLVLLQVYIQTGRPEAAWQALNASPFRGLESVALVEKRFDMLIRLKRLGDAREIFDRRLRVANRPDILASLFSFVPALYERQERQRMWTVLLERISAGRESSPPGDRSPWIVIQARVQLALRDTNAVVTTVSDLEECPNLGTEGEALRRISAALSDPQFPNYAKPKIFGIGLSRTGTTTLATALNLLGFHTLHWLNPLICEVISGDDFPVFDAFTDTPVSVRFETLYNQFPNSKFIFTKRDFDGWVRSMSGLWRGLFGASDFNSIKAELNESAYGEEFRDINHSLYFKYDSYREAFEAYEQRVRRFFRDKPAAHFLEFNIFAGDGWPELCAFVGRDVPPVPFPWENRRRSSM